MRVGILTGRNSVYAPLVIGQLEHDLTVWVKQSRQSRARQVRRTLQKSGVRYTADRIIGALRSGTAHSPEGQSIDTANTDTFRAEAATLDVVVSVFYPEILRPDIFTAPTHGGLNVHPGGLPDYAGSNPVFWTLAEGASEATVVVHQMAEQVDAGPVVSTATIPVPPRATLDAVYTELAVTGGRLLNDALNVLDASGTLGSVPAEPPNLRGAPTATAYRQFRRNGHRFA